MNEMNEQMPLGFFNNRFEEMEFYWRRFHQRHPEVWERFERATLELIARGRKNGGAKRIMEDLRWDTGIGGDGEKEFKIAAEHISFYARLFRYTHPEHADFFRFRRPPSLDMPPTNRGPTGPGDVAPYSEPKKGRDEIMEAAANYLLEEMQRGEPLQSPAESEAFLRCQFDGKRHETFGVIFLDTRHRVIAFEELFRGTIDGATVYPRVIAERALVLGSAAIICAHNHPSGIAEPSLADQAITRRIKESLALLDIRLLDHFIIGDGPAVSMASRGLL